jgi:hypothetical protein
MLALHPRSNTRMSCGSMKQFAHSLTSSNTPTAYSCSRSFSYAHFSIQSVASSSLSVSETKNNTPLSNFLKRKTISFYNPPKPDGSFEPKMCGLHPPIIHTAGNAFHSAMPDPPYDRRMKNVREEDKRRRRKINKRPRKPGTCYKRVRNRSRHCSTSHLHAHVRISKRKLPGEPP